MKLPQDEARWLFEEKYHFSRQQAIEKIEHLRLHPEQTLATLPKDIRHDLDQLILDVPVAYLIGWVKFLGCHIDLSLRPLIPRPETEEWVGRFLKETTATRVLDLCCGSGCIGVAVLKHLPNSRVTFVDIDPQMLKQSRLNVEQNEIASERSRFLESDLFSGVTEKYDAILANPPYVDPFGQFSPSLRHEPERALFAQNHGFKLVEQIILNAQKYLNEGGALWIEFEADQAKRVQQVANSIGWDVRVFQDQFGRDRFAILG